MEPAPTVSAFSLVTMDRKCTTLYRKNFGAEESRVIVKSSVLRVLLT